MKKLITILLASLLFSCVAMYPTYTVPTVNKTIEVQGTQDALFVKANLILVNVFHNSEAVIQYSDKEAGIIKGHYAVDKRVLFDNPYDGESYATITLTVKENEVHIVIVSSEHNEMYVSQEEYAKRVKELADFIIQSFHD